MNKTKMKIIVGVLLLGLFCGTAFAAPVIKTGESTPEDDDFEVNVGEEQTFSVTLNESGTVIWYVNDTDDNVKYQTTDSADPTSSFTYTLTEAVERFIKAVVQGNANASPEEWTIQGTIPAVEIDSFYPSDDEDGWEEEDDGDLIKTVTQSSSNSTFDFNITVSQNCTIEWNVEDSDGNSVGDTEKDEGVTFSEFDFDAGEVIDEYTITATATPNVGTSVSQSWIVKVVRKGYSSGNRIWEEGLSTTYTWDALSYSGFFYDLDDGEFSEELTITNIERNIDEGAIEYSTEPMETDFEYNDWESYQVIGFMAEKYFAGYKNSTPVDDDISLIKEGILAKVLTDTDDKESAYSGSSFILEDGYALNIVEVDVNGDTVWIQLEKDGDVVDDDFLASNDDYVYEADLGDADDVPIIIAHIGTVFAGQETSAVFIEGIFQISDNYIEIERGDSFGEMEITSVSSSRIEMENEDDVNLDEGDTIELMGKILIQVADDSTLRFAPFVDISEPGTYELRGTVYDEDEDGDSLPTWTPFNFEGFYYNIDEGIGTEELRIEELNGREIPDNKLVYESKPQPVEFEHDQWGYFQVIGFMAEKYFAGYIDEGDKKTTVGDEDLDVSLLSDNILCKVLTDTDDKESMYSGSALILEEGYALNIQE
ncbi:MAG: S-layer protein domain-containing protein, partial [Methanosarcinaceae archaeon]